LVDSTEDFIEFAAAVGPRLRRTAYLLCGDWHTAQDLTQTTLAKVFVAWHRINSGEGAYAYAHRTLVNCYLASLLLAVLPARQQISYLAAGSQQDRSVVASVDVQTSLASGSVQVQMGQPGGSRLRSCAGARAADGAIIGCRDYTAAGGTEVQELAIAAGVGSGNRVAEGYSYVFAATVRRADGVSVLVQASNFVPGPASLPPLTMAQVVTAAADPRWSWAMNSAFVTRAQRLRLTAPVPRACAQVQPADPRC
jgi:hypothetical protein